MTGAAFIKDAAIIHGQAAYVLARLFSREILVDYFDEHGTSEQWREPAIDAVDAIRRAGDAWARRYRAADVGNAELPKATGASPLVEMTSTVPTAAAAEALNVSDRRVRQLIDTGDLPAVREGRCWRIDAGAVSALAALRANHGDAPGTGRAHRGGEAPRGRSRTFDARTTT